MTNYCRLCAELKDPDEIATSITDTENLIEQKLKECCQWNVKNNNRRLPEDICMGCINKLDKCWMFSQSVQFAQQKLLEIFGKHQHITHTIISRSIFMKEIICKFSANDAESESEPEENVQPPKIVKILFDCVDCSNSFPSRIALEKHECNTETIHNQCNLCFKEYVEYIFCRIYLL